MAQKPRNLAAIDVGNQRVLALIAELDERDQLVIRGVGVAPSQGMRSGQVVQMKPVVAAIKDAVEEAEFMAKAPVERVWASVAGTFVSGRVTRAAVTLGPREREVEGRDLEALHLAAQRQPLPAGHTVLNVITHAYALDDQDGILDPLDMVGRQLHVDAYVVACQESHLRTLEKAINAAGLVVDEFIFSPIAGSLAVLTPDERRLGGLLVDIGYGTTSYAAFSGDRLLAAGCFPFGGNKLNDDLVHRFQTTAAGADKAKREAATMFLADIGLDETVSLPTIDARGGHVVPRRALCETIRVRQQEIFELVLGDAMRQLPSDTPFTGIVLTGGGAHLEGIVALAEEVFVQRARLGELEGVADSTHLLHSSELPSRSPAVAVGLLAYGRRVMTQEAAGLARPRRHGGGLLNRISKRLFAKKEVAHDHV